MKIIGIDPGLNITGYGILYYNSRNITLKEAGMIKTSAKDTFEKKLSVIYNGMKELLGNFNPDVMVVEKLYAHYKHPATAIKMGHARGVIFLAASLKKIKIVSYSATRIKNSLTGSGRASKKQVQFMIKSRLSLETLPEPPDIADAIAAAMCHINMISHSKYL